MKELRDKLNEIGDEEIKAARQSRDEGIKAFSDDKSMKDMYRSDCKDRIAIAKLVKAGRLREAWTQVSCLDSAVRDEVSNRLWNLLKAYPEW